MRVTSALIAALGLCSAAQPAFAVLQSCTVAATALPFGPYTVANVTPLAGTGTITVSCTVTLLGLLESWTISLNTGNSGSYAARQMSSGGNVLAYNLYTTAAYTQVWGDGSAGTGTIADSHLLSIGTSAYTYTVYGRVNALQDKPPGTYSDTLTVTVNY